MVRKPRFCAYYRVSTAQQGRSGLGIAAQKDKVREFVTGRGGEIIAEYTEEESGKDNERPTLAEALRQCRKTGSTLVVAKLDRLSRNAAFLMTLRDSGVGFVAADLPEANTMTVGVMAVVAQYEAEAISIRTKAALAAAKRKGTVLGGRREKAYDIRKCYKKGVKAGQKAADDRAELIRPDIEKLVWKGLTLRAVAKALDKANILSPRETALTERDKYDPTPRERVLWSAQGVANVIERLKIERPKASA